MTSKIYLQLLIIWSLIPCLAGGQELDLYSLESSKSFANYLYVKGDLPFAAEEYARILHMMPSDDTVLVRLSRIYRTLGEVKRAESLMVRHRTERIFENPQLEREWVSTMIYQADEQRLGHALERTQSLSDEEKRRSKVEQAMLHRNWEHAKEELLRAPSVQWKDAYARKTSEALAFRRKKPWLASTMSVFLPGSGKIYAKNAKEGITSFLFVAALGYQSYRAFNQRGSKSAAGWIYGSLGLGFYLGNIYGAQQSAKNYNKRKKDQIHREVDRLIYRRHH